MRDKRNIIKVNQFLRIIFFLTLTIWFSLSIFRSIFNFSKIITDKQSILVLNEEQIRIQTFGEEYRALRAVQELTPDNSKILFIFFDQKIPDGFFYKSLYFLYPRKIYIEDKINTINQIAQNKKPDYIFLLFSKSVLIDLKKHEIIQHFNKLSFYSFETKSLSGLLIKYE